LVYNGYQINGTAKRTVNNISATVVSRGLSHTSVPPVVVASHQHPTPGFPASRLLHDVDGDGFAELLAEAHVVGVGELQGERVRAGGQSRT
jgi:hypothetical protein